jgi:hypothetical protein
VKGFLIAGLVAAVASPASAQQSRPPIDQLRQVGPSIYRCWHPPAGSAGDEVTVTMSFKRDGAVLGKPRISHSKLTGSDDDQKAFVASVLGAIAACTPLHLSDSLGGSMAGRPFAMRFISTSKQSDV